MRQRIELEGNLPDHREDKRGINVDEERSNLIPVVEDEAVPPGNHGACQRSKRDAIAGNKQRGTCWHGPDKDKVQDVDVIA